MISFKCEVAPPPSLVPHASLLPRTALRCTALPCRDWLGYILPSVLFLSAVNMVWLRFVQHSDRRRPNPRRNEVVVVAPPNRNAVEQLVELQQSLAQVGAGWQAGGWWGLVVG